MIVLGGAMGSTSMVVPTMVLVAGAASGAEGSASIGAGVAALVVDDSAGALGGTSAPLVSVDIIYATNCFSAASGMRMELPIRVTPSILPAAINE